MSHPLNSTIAQMVYLNPQTLNFARIVKELEAVLSRLNGNNVLITWDCDDLVMFDLVTTRIALAWNDRPGKGFGGCLTVSVGPTPADAANAGDPGHDVLCSRLAERIQNRFPPDAILWHQAPGVVRAELIDALADALPPPSVILPPVAAPEPPLRPAKRAVRAIARQPAPTAVMPAVANDAPHIPPRRNAELARLREALYPPVLDGEIMPPLSTQMRLAVHALNATLILVWAPLGAAVMTYSLLKGEDIRLSARIMAMTGTLFALSQSPVGQTMAAMAGV